MTQKQIRIHGKADLLRGAVLQENGSGYEENALMVINDIPCIVTQVGGVLTWCPLIRGYTSNGYVHEQHTTSQVWSFQHNLGTQDLWIVGVDNVTNTVVTPAVTYSETDPENHVILTFPTAIKGTAYLVGTKSFHVDTFVGGKIKLGENCTIDETTLFYGNESIPLSELVTMQEQLQALEASLLASLATVQTPDVPVKKRHCVVHGSVDESGKADFLTSAPNSFNVGVKGTVKNLLLTFAHGYSNKGQVDYLETINADQSTFWSNLPAKQLVFLGIRRGAPGILSALQTLAEPLAAYSFPFGNQSCLRFSGVAGSTTITDDFGITWTRYGNARLQTNWVKTGIAALGGDGVSNAISAGDFIRTTEMRPVGYDSWTLRAHCRPTSLPGAGTVFTLAHLSSGTQYGAQLGLIVNGGAFKVFVNLSGNGTSWNIANAIRGNTAFAVNIDIHLAIVYDRIAGAYYVYANGQLELTFTTQQRICGSSIVTVGANYAGNTPFLGYIDSVEILPYCVYPAGDSFTPPTTEVDITQPGYASEWFDISEYKMKRITAISTIPGIAPVSVESGTLFVGEVYTNTSGALAAISYAYQGKYDTGAAIQVNSPSVYNLAHNIGSKLVNVVSAYAEFQTSVGGWTPGDRITFASNGNKTFSMPFAPVLRRTQAVVATGSANGYMPQANGGNFVTYVAGDLAFGFTLERDY